MSETAEAPRIERTEAHEGGTVRLRANSKYTQKEGWHGADITVEYTGPFTSTYTLFEGKTLELHEEITDACQVMNAREGRA